MITIAFWLLAAPNHPAGADPKAAFPYLQIVKDRHDLADRLLSTLNDSKLSSGTRLQAAKALGELRYEAAIPSLIKHLTLYDESSSGLFGEIDPALPYPCAQALHQFGPEVIAPVIKRYVEEEDPIRRELLSDALRRGTPRRSLDTSIRYARGFGFELTDRIQLGLLIELYGHFYREKGDRPVIPSEWLKDK
jgi:hypothetical protein